MVRKVLVTILFAFTITFSSTAFASDEGEIVLVRDFLIQQGYSDKQIMYDHKRHMVILNGRDFFILWPQEDGKTYAKKKYLEELVELHKKGDYKVYGELPNLIK